ncbi:F-box protein SKIP22-like [Glycine soja]|uniref:F-box protein SKIP22 isoform A n=2 Tax=Glycine soja TaxID=3848 RepID=A0A445F4K4_GLYSO|nr:F-box protein SKIP22-like [Glycine soja]RZB43781.1 F-box protein SKIP22 isoform A [Glycine soja]RZB43782.1 F-box protein SKIP22 isoform B [Glycine soja]
MKLRLRSLESKETLKIEVPDSCSLLQLKDTVSRTISSSSSSLHLSLNRKDEIHAPSPEEPLHSLGVAAGDLIFYSLNPIAFTLGTLLHKPETASRDGPSIQDSPETLASDSPSVPDAEKPPTLDAAELEPMEMIDGSDEMVVVGTNSEPFFVRRVLKEALGNNVNDFKLLVFAVHGVVLESGFVRIDKDCGMAVTGSHLLDDSPPAFSSVISLRYALPEILANGASHSVNLKFQTLGHFVNVCGSLSDDVGSRLHFVCLDKRKYVRPLELMLANSEAKGSVNDGEDILFGSEVFEMWKMVKDRLALPLLIDLCEKAGFDLPPCFTRLPMELKLLILERLPGVDLAKVACTCSELRYLSTSNELWKKKYEEEFGKEGDRKGWLFKDLFAVSWETKKRWRAVPFRRRGISRNIIFSPNHFRMPPVWGGEYGVQPVFGVPFPRYQLWRNIIPSRTLTLGDFNI